MSTPLSKMKFPNQASPIPAPHPSQPFSSFKPPHLAPSSAPPLLLSQSVAFTPPIEVQPLVRMEPVIAPANNEAQQKIRVCTRQLIQAELAALIKKVEEQEKKVQQCPNVTIKARWQSELDKTNYTRRMKPTKFETTIRTLSRYQISAEPREPRSDE